MKKITLKQVIENNNEWSIQIEESVISYLSKKGDKFIEKFAKRLDYILNNPSKLKRIDGKEKFYRFRMEDYRVIVYVIIIKKDMKIELIGKRSDVYKK